MDKLMALYDGLNNKDEVNLSAFDTSIDIKNLETGEIIFKGLKNKVILPGSGLIARKLFDIGSDSEEVTPSYNDAITGLYTPENDVDESDATVVRKVDKKTNASADKDNFMNNHKILLYCVGIDGCGTENSQVYPVDYKKWLRPQDMIPFRFQPKLSDISDDLRETYFGRSEIDFNGTDFVAYYFKRFENMPTLIQQYVDGTQITKESNVPYDSDKAEAVETYVELDLKITKEDIRQFFTATVGIDEARINTLSLCSARPVIKIEQDRDGNKIERLYFKDIRPVTKLNIPNEQLIDVTKGIEIIYHIYM